MVRFLYRKNDSVLIVVGRGEGPSEMLPLWGGKGGADSGGIVGAAIVGFGAALGCEGLGDGRG